MERDQENRYRTPSNEEDRLEEVYRYGLLDTPADDKFDRLTEIARNQLSMEFAAVTLVAKDRQWYKSTAGFDNEGLPRSQSLCNRAIMDDAVTIHEDLLDQDEFDASRYQINGEQIRSYAGAPIITPSGYRLGTFCVFDRSPTSFSEDDIQLLRLLRDQTTALIEQRKQKQQLEYLANHDPVTDLPNQRHFLRRFEDLIETHEEKEQQLALFHVNLTRFQRINLTLGIKLGEEALRIIAERLRERFPESYVMTRTQGNSFLVAAPRLKNQSRAKDIGGKILDALREPVPFQGEQFDVSTRIGYALFPVTGIKASDLLRQANAAVEETEPRNGQRIRQYLPHVTLSEFDRLTLEEDFTTALQDGELFLRYQPEVDLESEDIEGVEALIRWEHSEHGFVPSPTIVSLAETLGLVSELGNWVLKEACNQVKKWNRNRDRDLRLAVNVSALELLKGEEFLEAVQDILERTNFSPSLLQMDIAETDAMEHIGFTEQVMKDLHRTGISTAIDDFGTGRSSLASLASVPVSRLKIDRRFVDGLASTPEKQIVVESILEITRKMGLETIAEGVEQKEDLQGLRELGANYYQGYQFSRPLDPPDLEQQFLHDQNGND